VNAPELRGTKRTAEDAEFDDLAELVSQVLNADRDLTRKIHDVDKQIELLQTQREDLIEKRKDLKRRFTRQTLAVASRTDG
jgi:chromosome segregation ATPase